MIFQPMKKDEMEIRWIINEKTENAIASEKSLAKNWDNYEEDKAWEDL